MSIKSLAPAPYVYRNVTGITNSSHRALESEKPDTPRFSDRALSIPFDGLRVTSRHYHPRHLRFNWSIAGDWTAWVRRNLVADANNIRRNTLRFDFGPTIPHSDPDNTVLGFLRGNLEGNVISRIINLTNSRWDALSREPTSAPSARLGVEVSRPGLLQTMKANRPRSLAVNLCKITANRHLRCDILCSSS